MPHFASYDCYSHASIYGSFVSFFIKLILFVNYNKIYFQLIIKFTLVIYIAY